MFRKILIANRGEIAVRILHACRELGVPAAVVYSEADRTSLHVRLAEEAYPIGPAPSRQSYLVIENVLGAAREAGCDAIHPGYGFLSENAAFARACAAAGVTFIGPGPEAMEQLGSKTAARQVAQQIGIPTVAGTLGPVANAQEALAVANKIGFPVVLKAVAGGGGKGMRLIESQSGLSGAWRDAGSEAQNAFGDGRLYLEKYLLRPRHIEIQVLGDHHGNFVYLGERECSIQRRYQKVIEEAPSPVMTLALRQAMGEAAVKLARAGGYRNAGTVEFLLDADGKFYFLEVNTRLQVEHPVTEMITSLDLVKLQIHIAAGDPLPFDQANVVLRGHAIECRLCAEDPDNNFFPSPGRVSDHRAPSGPGIRLEEGIYAGWVVPNEYDPLLGKLIAWGKDRPEAIARLHRALGEYYASGIQTNVALLRRILESADFQRGEIYTRWLDEFLTDRAKGGAAPGREGDISPHAEEAALLAAALWYASRNHRSPRPAADAGPERESRWKLEGRFDQLSRDPRR